MVAKFGPRALSEADVRSHAVIKDFALGADGSKPTAGVLAMATNILAAALEFATDPEFSVDEDGDFSLDLRLSNGMRMLAELPIDGTLDVGIYDDRDSTQPAREVEYLFNATADDLIALL